MKRLALVLACSGCYAVGEPACRVLVPVRLPVLTAQGDTIGWFAQSVLMPCDSVHAPR